MSPDFVALIRDISIIVMAAMVTIAAATILILALKIYPRVQRAARNLETSSQLMVDTASRISGLLTTGSGLGMFLWELIGRLSGRSKPEPPAENGKPS